jgi:hypothetical protein
VQLEQIHSSLIDGFKLRTPLRLLHCSRSSDKPLLAQCRNRKVNRRDASFAYCTCCRVAGELSWHLYRSSSRPAYKFIPQHPVAGIQMFAQTAVRSGSKHCVLHGRRLQKLDWLIQPLRPGYLIRRPADQVRRKWVASEKFFLNMSTPKAFKRALLKTFWAGRNIRR